MFVRLYPEAARAAADAADARQQAGVSLGPLDGAIVSIKDLFDVAGETTLAGSIALRDRPPATEDAAIVRRLRQAGAVILGKTNMVEFAYSGLGLNPHYGTPGNAADPPAHSGRLVLGRRRVRGGGHERDLHRQRHRRVRAHSGGAQRRGRVQADRASRAARQAPFPSRSAWIPSGRWRAPFRTAPSRMRSWPAKTPWTAESSSLAGLRIGIPRGRLFADTEPMVEQAFEAASSRLSQAGARIVDHGIDDLLAAMAETHRRGLHRVHRGLRGSRGLAGDQGGGDRSAGAVVDRAQRHRSGADLYPHAAPAPRAGRRHG